MVRKFICSAIALLVSVALLATNEVKVISFGEGSTERDAIHNALRGALEDAYGAFISSSTIVKNDILVSDEISTLTKGNIKKYQLISSINDGNKYVVSVESIVSLDKFSNYCASKGMKVEYNGAALNMTLKMLEYNKENRHSMKNHLLQQLSQMTDYYDMYDYKLKITDQKLYEWENTANITMEISYKENKNYKAMLDFVSKNMKAMALTKEEIQTYESLGLDYRKASVYGDDIAGILACMKYCFILTAEGWKSFLIQRYIPYDSWQCLDRSGEFKFNGYRLCYTVTENPQMHYGGRYKPSGPLRWTQKAGLYTIKETLELKLPLSCLENISSFSIKPMSETQKYMFQQEILKLQIK